MKPFTTRKSPEIVTNISCHLFGAYFGKVPGHDPVVQRVEHAHQPRVHPRRRLRIEDKVESHEGGEHGEVSEHADDVADLVDEQEPLVHQSRRVSL